MRYDSASTGPNKVRLYQGITTNQYVGTPGNTSYFGYQNDFLFLGGVTSQPVLFSDWMRCSAIGGYLNFSTEAESEIVTRPFKPTNVMHKWQEDKQRYGYGFFYPEVVADPGVHLRERTVYHSSYRGFLRDLADQDVYHYIPGGDAYGWIDWTFEKHKKQQYSLAPWAHQVCTGVDQEGYLSFSQVKQDTNALDVGFEAFSWVNQICDLIGPDGSVVYTPNVYWQFIWSNVVNTSFMGENSYHFRIAYDYKMLGGDVGWPPNWGLYHVNLSFDLRFREIYGQNSVYNVAPIHPDVVDFHDSSTVQLVSNASWMVSNPPLVTTPIVVTAVGDPAFLTIPVGATFGRQARDNNFHNYCRGSKSKDLRLPLDYSVVRRLQHHTDLNREWLPDLRASSFFSFDDALRNVSGNLQANHLENLSQLEGLKDILPTLKPLLLLMTKVMKGDPSALKDLIDYVTDAILRYRFAQKPLAADADELARADIRKMLESKFASQSYTAYGSFKYVFSDEDNPYGDGKLILVTRTKVRVHTDFGTTVGAIMAADGSGVLPTLSRLWALLPFSFVIDWIFNMEGRLDAIDRAFLYKCYLTHWAVHSYTLTYFPSDEVLASFGLYNPDSNDPFGLNVYSREFTRYAPYLRGSRFDYLRSEASPNLATVLSLVWQVFT